MADFDDADLPSVDNDDIGLGDEDKDKVHSNQLEWYKGEKGRTDRVALVYFNTVDQTVLRKALKAKPDLTKDQQRTLLGKARAQLAEKLGKTADQLEKADLLDVSEARFKAVTGSYKQGLGYVSWPKNMSAEEERVWKKAGERKDYVCTVLLWYPTDRDGEIDKDRLPKQWRVIPWRMAPEKWQDLRKINRGLQESGSSVSQIDLNLSCSDTNYQKITITPSGPAIYLRAANFKKTVLEKAELLYSKLNPFREMSTDELREKLGLMPAGGAAPGSDYAGEDFGNILGNV
jgi:hypothetical protein